MTKSEKFIAFLDERIKTSSSTVSESAYTIVKSNYENIHSSIMTKSEADKLKPQAKDFIRKCNVIPLVHANEGGVLYLEELLVDFVRYLDNEDKNVDKRQDKVSRLN